VVEMLKFIYVKSSDCVIIQKLSEKAGIYPEVSGQVIPAALAQKCE
jgi:hypothetical protein